MSSPLAGAEMDVFEAENLSPLELKRWREFLEAMPCRHYTQDPAWVWVLADSYSTRRRRPWFTWAEEGGKIVLVGAGLKQQSPAPGLFYFDFDKGPAFSDCAVFERWLKWVSQRAAARGVFVRVSPHWELGLGGDEVETNLARAGFRRDRAIGTVATLLVDLRPQVDQIMGGLRRQTRQQINRTWAAGVTVAEENTSEGRSAFRELYSELAARNGLIPMRDQDLEAIDRHWFNGGPGGTLLLARLDGEAIAGGLVLAHGDTAYYTTAASTRNVKALGTSHAVVWAALLWAREQGCSRLDLCGYSLLARPEDALHGVNRFKQGFAPKTEPAQLCAMHELRVRPLTCEVLRRARHFKRRLSLRKELPADEASHGYQA